MLRDPEQWCHHLLPAPTVVSRNGCRDTQGTLAVGQVGHCSSSPHQESTPDLPQALSSAPEPTQSGLRSQNGRRRSRLVSPPYRGYKSIKAVFEPLLLLLPFIRVVRDLLNLQGPYRITREAILALRTTGEDYIMATLEGANFGLYASQSVYPGPSKTFGCIGD